MRGVNLESFEIAFETLAASAAVWHGVNESHGCHTLHTLLPAPACPILIRP